MSWRDRIAKMLAGGAGAKNDLPMDVYHGTKRVFPEFKQWDVKDAYTIDRALGTHVAKDPAMSSEAFAGVPPEYSLKTGHEAWDGTPHVIPLKAPPDEAFLQAAQTEHRKSREGQHGFVGKDPLWSRVTTDTRAIENMAAQEAYMRDPDLLKAHLERGRAMREPEARAVSRALLAGESPKIDNMAQDLPFFLNNYGAPPGDVLKQKVTDLARDSWQGKGYAGIKYINTAPMEAGAKGVTDPTSYVVFDPADLRSRFAAFDPSKIRSRDLMSGVAGAAGMGALYDQSRLEDAR